MIEKIRQQIQNEEFDYGLLMSALKNYKNPRNKVSSLLKQEKIIRVKKGLYVWGKDWRKQPIQLNTLANLIYGPSIVSCDSALSYYGFIPEGVKTITSSGVKPSKEFQTPLGRFKYQKVPINYHHLGLRRIETQNSSYLIASPERALSDRLLEIPNLYRPNRKELEILLLESMRIEPKDLMKLDIETLEKLASQAKSPRLKQLCFFINEYRKKS